MKLIYYPDSFLEKVVDPVDIENPDFDPHELKKEMVDTMIKCGGIGLSANQVGIDRQVFVMGDTRANSTICINPQILQYTEETVTDAEGCLSFPNLYLNVKRPKDILVTHWNENLEQVTEKVTGYSARVYLHELDHLLGITFRDRVSKLRWDMAAKKANKVMKNGHRY